MSARASTQSGKRWHQWLGRGIATCGAKVIEDTAPFDPASANSCRLCARSFKPAYACPRELPNPQLTELRQKTTDRAKASA